MIKTRKYFGIDRELPADLEPYEYNDIYRIQQRASELGGDGALEAGERKISRYLEQRATRIPSWKRDK